MHNNTRHNRESSHSKQIKESQKDPMATKVQSRDKSECLEKSRSVSAKLGGFVKIEKETLSQRDYIEREEMKGQPVGIGISGSLPINDSMEQKTAHTKDSK